MKKERMSSVLEEAETCASQPVPLTPEAREFSAPRSLSDLDKDRSFASSQAALVIAKTFPRDELAAEIKLLAACRRYALAEQALYAYPRGQEKITAPSIRLAEAIAQHWGNIHFGLRELEHAEGYSVVEAFAWDLEANTRQSRVFTVQHKIETRKGVRVLSDAKEIYEHAANLGARRLRACILGVVPGDLVDKAVRECERTLNLGEKHEPMVDRIKRMLLVFAEVGVTRVQLEARLGHALEQTTPLEIIELQKIYMSLRDHISGREDWFSSSIGSQNLTENDDTQLTSEQRHSQKVG